MATGAPARRSSNASARAPTSPSSASTPDEQVIDVSSLAPALLPSSPRQQQAEYVPARRGSRALSLSGGPSAKASGGGKAAAEGDQETPHEHQYPRGRQQIPMESPGDELLPDLQLDEDEDVVGDGDGSSSSANGNARLPRMMRNRVFFQSDDIPRSYRYRSSRGVLQRITLRKRRKRGPYEWFWTAIAVTTLLSLSLLTCVVIYLMQTDFFASHQSELLGTTVENRFTVVSQQDASAKIYLKSGHSKSQLSESMIAFADGELRIGRRALEASEPQSFFGLLLFTNGTAAFTNRVEAPTIATEYLHATKAVVFEDGTVMTTAANMSGGVKEVGDLNLVSQSGSVVTSAGGKPLLVVEPSGAVTVANSDAEDPTASGIKLDGAKGSISIANDFFIRHDGNTSSVSTPLALHLNSSGLVLGNTKGGKVTLTVAENIEEAAADKADEETTRRELAGQDAADSESSTAESESVTLEVVGQASSTQKEGGDVRIAGGNGLEIGGDVALVGGASTDTTPVEYGTISINANLDESSSSLTEIGSHSKTHSVDLHGLISMNRKSSGTFDNTTTVRIAGGLFNVSAQRITLNNSAVTGSKLRVDSKDLRMGTMGTPSIRVGTLSYSDVVIEGSDVGLDASEDISIGAKASVVTIGKSRREGQSVNVASESIVLDASKSLSIHPTSTNAKTTVGGQVLFQGNTSAKSAPAMAVANNAISLNAPSVRVGETGVTTDVSIESAQITIGEPEVNGSLVTGKVEITSATIEIGAEDSAIAVQGDTVAIDAQESVVIGKEADSVAFGSDKTGKVILRKNTVAVSGAVSVAGATLDIDSVKIVIGKNSTSDIAIGSSAAKSVTVDGQTVSVGNAASSVAIGSKRATIDIGSADSVVNLLGKVSVNGEDLNARRRLSSDHDIKAFGYVNAKQFGLPVKQGHARFSVPFESGFASDPSIFQLDTATERFLSVAMDDASSGMNGESSRHIRLSLDITRLRLQVGKVASSAAASTKIRCSVFRHGQYAADAETVLEASGQVEHCSGSDCQDGIFGGLAAQRLIRLGPGDSCSTVCLVVAATVGGELLGNDAQLSFSEL